MINHNLALYEALDKTMSINAFGGDWVVNYTEGDLFELTKKLDDSNTKYPIIWLQSGYKVARNHQQGQTQLENCKIFFITKGDMHDRYEKRYSTAYDEMLYPLLGKFDKLMRKTAGFFAADTDNFTTFPFNDTTELNRRSTQNGTKTPQQTAIIDIWDALLLETDITLDNCQFEHLKIK